MESRMPWKQHVRFQGGLLITLHSYDLPTLPFYAILRSIENKEGGVACFAFSIVILGFLPLLTKFTIKSSKFDIISQFFFWLFISNVILLGWLGSQVVEYPYVEISRIATISYFSYFLVIIPTLSFFESKVLKI